MIGTAESHGSKMETKEFEKSNMKIIKIETSSRDSLTTSSISPRPTAIITAIGGEGQQHISSSSSPSSSPSNQCFMTYTPYPDLIADKVIQSTVTSISSSTRGGQLKSEVKKGGRRNFTNCRERQRQQNVNEAFKELRSKIPTEPVDKKLSKCSILTRAIEYIKLLNGILEKMEDDCRSCSRKRPRYDQHDEVENKRKAYSDNSMKKFCDSDSDEDDIDRHEDEDDDEEETVYINQNEKTCLSRKPINSRPILETNMSITRVESTSFSQLTRHRHHNHHNQHRNHHSNHHRVSPAIPNKQSCDLLDASQDSEGTIRSEDKMIMDETSSLVSYEFESSLERSVSSTISSPSDSD